MALVVLVVVGITALTASAKPYHIPVEGPKFLIDFPEDWEVKISQDEYDIYGISPDETIEYYVWKIGEMKPGNIKEVVESSIEEVLENVKEYVRNAKFGKFEYEQKNGIEVLWAEGTGKYRDGGEPVIVAIDLFSPDEKNLFCLLYFGTKDGQKKNEKVIKRIDDSLKKL